MYFANTNDELYELHINLRVMELIATIEETQQARSGGEGSFKVLDTMPQVPRTYSRSSRGISRIITDSSSVPPSELDLDPQRGNPDSLTYDQEAREEENQAS